MALPTAQNSRSRKAMLLNRDNLPGGLNRRSRTKVNMPNAVIPDLPKIVGCGAYGRAGDGVRADFERDPHLAREVAFVRLLDSGTAAAGARPTANTAVCARWA